MSFHPPHHEPFPRGAAGVPPQGKPPSKPSWGALVLLLVVAVASTWWLVGAPTKPAEDTQAARLVTPRGDLLPHEQTTIELFEQASPAVVYITTLARVPVRRLFGADVRTVPKGTGSGFVWDAEGHIVTNFHVIAQGAGALVRLSDGSEHDAKLVGVAPDQDLAVLKVDAPVEKLQALAIGTSSDLKVGQFCMAIGNPFGLDRTLTTGVISALDREIESASGRTIYGVVQTDASINPGNSGGPLLDSAGRLIGVNTAIQSPSGASAGIGFAVPVDTVNRVVPQLIAGGKVARPGLGVLPAPDAWARQIGAKGVLLRGLSPGSSAERAGLVPMHRDETGRLRTGDIIVAVGEDEVENLNDLLRVLDGRSVGDRVKLTVDRDGAQRSVELTLQEVQ